MASAIELYRDAYHQDYRKGDWETAEELYKKIVAKYPQSDEKEYALVHLDRLEKLKADPDDQELKPSRPDTSSSSNALSVVNFFFILISFLCLAGLGYLFWIQKQEIQYVELILQGQLSEKAGQYQTASDLYKRACKTNTEKPLAFQFLSEFYLSRAEYGLAQSTLDIWKSAHPYSDQTSSFESRLRAAKNSAGRK